MILNSKLRLSFGVGVALAVIQTAMSPDMTKAQEVYNPTDTAFDYDYDDSSIQDNYYEDRYLEYNEFPDNRLPHYGYPERRYPEHRRSGAAPYARRGGAWDDDRYPEHRRYGAAPYARRGVSWDDNPYYQDHLWEDPSGWFDDNDYEYTSQDYYDPYDHDVGRFDDITLRRGEFRRALPR